MAAPTLDIGVDLDGVCYDFAGAVRRHVLATTSRTHQSMPAPTTWHFYETDWDMPLAEFIDHVNAGVAAGIIFGTGDPYPGVQAGLTELLARGHRIHIITDRGRSGPPGAGEALTRAWLAEHDLPYTTLTVSGDKTAVRTDVFIDDRPENYLALRGAGVDAFLRSHPYNAHVDTPPGRRVGTFADFTDAIGRQATQAR